MVLNLRLTESSESTESLNSDSKIQLCFLRKHRITTNVNGTLKKTEINQEPQEPVWKNL